MATEGDKENCWAMDYWGDCKICPGKCSYKQHQNVDHRIEFEKVKMVRISICGDAQISSRPKPTKI
jgi:hypothetical protein